MSKELTFIDAIFIGGTGRSGTTILGKLLGRHHQIQLAKPVEIKFLTAGTGLLDLNRNALISRAGKITLLRNGNFLKFQKSVNQKWWEREAKHGGRVGLSSGISRDRWDDIERELGESLRFNRSGACQSFFRAFLDSQLEPSFEINSKKLWVDTTPPNLMRAGEIASLLPGSRFIHIIRDGRDVASSVVHENWGPNSFNESLIWWSKRIKKILKSTRPIKKQVLHIWFEDLVHHNREGTLAKVLNFLDLEEDDTLKKYFDDMVVPASSNTGRWRNEVADKVALEHQYQVLLHGLVERGLIEPTRQI